MTYMGQRIRSLRESADLNQTELSEIINVSRNTLSQYESGDRTPNDDVKRAIADYFKVSLDYLMGRKKESVIDLYPNRETLKAFIDYVMETDGIAEPGVDISDEQLNQMKELITKTIEIMKIGQ